MKKNKATRRNCFITSREAKKKIPFAIIGFVSFCAYYLLNINTPPFGDDIMVLFKNFNMGAAAEVGQAERITHFSDIIYNLIRYYFNYRGRLTAEGLEMVFAVYGKQYFNLLNSLIFAGVACLVYFHSNYGKKANWRLLLLVCVVFWFLTPNMTNTYLWMVCSFYSVWPIFFILLFLVPYRKLISENYDVEKPVRTAVFVVLTGFFAGSLSELSLGLSIGFAAITILILLFRKKRVPTWSIMGLISTVCGTAILFLSPGYKNNCLEKYGQTPLELFLHELPNRIPGAVYLSLKVTKALLPFVIIILIWLIADIRKSAKAISAKKRKKSETVKSFYSFMSFVNNKNGLLMPVIFFAIMLGSIAITTVLPYYEYRLFFTVFSVCTLMLFSLLSEVVSRMEQSDGKLNQAVFNKKVMIAAPVLISIIALLDFGKEYRIYHQHFEVYTAVTEQIRAEVAAGNKDIVVRNTSEIPQLLLPEGRLRSIINNWSVTGLTEDVTAPMNRHYAYYFNAKTIKGERRAGNPPTSIKDGIIASNY